MWKEITLTQAQNYIATKKDTLLDKMCSIQAEMTEYYEKISTPENLAGVLINKAKLYNARAFFYDDGKIEMNLVFKNDSEEKLRCLTSALGKCNDIDKAVKLTMKKVFDVMGEYKSDYVYGFIPADRKALGNTWFNKFIIKKVFIDNGFRDIKLTEVEEGKRTKLEVWK